MKSQTQNDSAALWDAEYHAQGIPSSFSSEPSGAVRDLAARLDALGVCPSVAIDIGCGTGRNSLWLAQRGWLVWSLDIVDRLIANLVETAISAGLGDRVHAFCQSVTGSWPIPDNACELAIDTFCFKHLIDEESRDRYVVELQRCLRPGGYYLLTLAGRDDGYYRAFLQPGSGGAIIDPGNGIGSTLYDKEDVEALFSRAFEPVEYFHKLKSGLMHGSIHLRSTHVFLMRRRTALNLNLE